MLPSIARLIKVLKLVGGWATPLKNMTSSVGMKAGWWLSHPSEKYDFVSWDDEIPNIWRKIKNVPIHQQYIYIYVYDILYLLSQYYIIYMETKKNMFQTTNQKVSNQGWSRCHTALIAIKKRMATVKARNTSYVCTELTPFIECIIP